MRKEMEKIDALIKEALTEEEAAFYDSLEEKNLLGKLGSVYRGKMGWLAVITSLFQLALFIVFIFCLVQFFRVEETQELIKWACGGFLSLMAVSMLKMFIWMQIDKNDILLEMKKLELQLASHMERSNR